LTDGRAWFSMSRMKERHITAIMSRLASSLGGAGAAAKSLGVSATYFSEVVRGVKPPAGKLLQALGLERVISYRRRK